MTVADKKKRYFVIRTTKNGIEYKRTKTLDKWSKSPIGCWQFSEQGAEKIAKRMNEKIEPKNKRLVHYNTLECAKVLEE